LSNVLLSMGKMGAVRESLLHGEISILRRTLATRSHVWVSQVIKVIKTGDLRRALRYLWRRIVRRQRRELTGEKSSAV